jgi:hypothetical protein
MEPSPWTEQSRALASVYLDAKQRVIEAGFAWEIDWQSSVDLARITESDFLREAAWVILCAGMSEGIVRRHFGKITEAFLGWESAIAIAEARSSCEQEALLVFNHRGKVAAITRVAESLVDTGFDHLRDRVLLEGPDVLQQLPFIGPVTALHLAKNIGLPVAKPDRHLLRIAVALHYSSPSEICRKIAVVIQEPIAVVDIVLWRFATLERNYASLLARRYESARGAPELA